MNVNKITIISAIVVVAIISGVLATQNSTQNTSSFTLDRMDDSTINNSEKKDFVFAFYSEIAEKNKHSNLFFSPFSISTAFSLAYEGAMKNTESEMQEVFGFEENNSIRHKEISDTLIRLNPQDKNYSLEVANALWVKEGYNIKKNYTDIAQEHYSSTIKNVDFVSNDGINRINKWTSEKTQDKIQDILMPGSTDEMTRMVITNAVYFMGKWAMPFSPHHTTEQPFWTDKDNSVMIPMMKKSAAIYNYAETNSLQALELNYLGGDISMIILLPKEKEGISSLEQSIDIKTLNAIKSSMTRTPLTLEFPKFEFETEYNLIKSLRSLGLEDAFDKDIANFQGITDEQVYLKQAVHKAFVNVNEEGTEAAAITALVMQAESGPPEPIAEFVADHPFMFIIQEKGTGEILFIGRMMDPTT